MDKNIIRDSVRKAEKASEAQKTAQQTRQDMMDNSKYAKQAGTISGDDALIKGRMEGLERAGQLYGMGIQDIGQETQDIVKRRREMLDGSDPASDALRRSKNAQLRAASARGATEGQLAQIERSAAQDIGQQEFMAQDRALDDYQRLVGNILGGTSSLEMGMGSLLKSGETPAAPNYNQGFLGTGTVICTELHAQGYMSDKTLELDREHGKYVRLNDPACYIGYIFLASPIVRIMRKSELFTSLISIPAMAWANDMAYGNSMAGKIINKIGKPVCRFVGKIVVSLHRKGLVYA